MAVIKCKMCGGDLVIEPGATVAECEYCGSRQTVPNQDNEKKLTLFARANRLRASCEFDKAAGIYESIVAEFPQEAEAYWGLVLCKYGIEYVDDPATGKKIPTCHRSSFESVLDDSNFDQALENADVVARKVYREEAKQIEELRKGIIEVSAKEKPYDIFICYKETDDKGDRTLDSVLAQDIYDALTEKGYRVFFSRITLEDKLGQEYEPYIFAALNSAKILLAVGTDYEYYNAVWVKNEWSRYLMLMAKDRKKHLIPCYKNIDAYDMPKEFAKLQAQDMGKVGAMQDLLRGIEKILPKSAQTAVAQESKTVIFGGGNDKITSLLERGYLALEDGNWEKAESFFADVLTNDDKNAQAYIGVALAREECRTIDSLVRKRLDTYQKGEPEHLPMEPAREHIAEMAGKYAIPGIWEEKDIRRLYVCPFELSYLSFVIPWKGQYEEEKSWWVDNRELTRAEKYAVGEVARNLQSVKTQIFTKLEGRVKNAQERETASLRQAQEKYAGFLAEVDAKVEKQYQSDIERRERKYDYWVEQARSTENIVFLGELAQDFDSLNGFRDSKNLAEHCRKRAADEREKLNTEKKRQEAIAKQKQKEAADKKKKAAVVAIVIIVAVVVTALLVTKVIIPGNAYKKAESLLASGQYEEASAAFEALGGYKDSQQRIEDCKTAEIEADYQAANKLVEEGRIDEAIEAFENLGEYKDSSEQISELTYRKAQQLYGAGDIAKAAMIFGRIDNYKDAREQSYALWHNISVCDVISTGSSHTIGLKSDGTVFATGLNDDGQCDVSGWKNIVAVSAGINYTVGLKSDGTVVAIGKNAYGQCNVHSLENVVALNAYANHTVCLKSDGRVVAVGDNGDGECNISDWREIIAVSAGARHTVGLKQDGTVVATGSNEAGQCDISDWKDIVAVSAGGEHTVGLKSDGTVVAVGGNGVGQCNVSGWRDIVAVRAGGMHTIGLKSDGTVMAVGWNKDGECDVSSWENIVSVSAGGSHTVGVKSDGTVVAVGINWFGECDVSHWKDVRLPHRK